MDFDFSLYKQIVQKTEKELKEYLYEYIKNKYAKIDNNELFLYAKGNIPILLIAHLDTVFSKPPSQVFYNKEAKIIFSTEGGIGDDRAGVYAVLKIISDNYKPHILFTCGEEIGGQGARAFVKKYSSPMKNLKYIIELDRQGEKDCVFYDCDNKDFTKYIEDFDFLTNWGTFTDISIICPKWKIAGVNLSIGYFNEHTTQEILLLDFLGNTITKVKNLLEDNCNISRFDYIETEMLLCDCCAHYAPFLEPVYYKGTKVNLCWDCLKIARWCPRCGKAFFPEQLDDILCGECKNDYLEQNRINSTGKTCLGL